jgi:hypothetical protein
MQLCISHWTYPAALALCTDLPITYPAAIQIQSCIQSLDTECQVHQLHLFHAQERLAALASSPLVPWGTVG